MTKIDSDDDAAHKKRIKILKNENKKLIPDRQVVSELMEKTYTYRRRQILEEPVMVANLLDTFPFLSEIDQVCDCVAYLFILREI